GQQPEQHRAGDGDDESDPGLDAGRPVLARGEEDHVGGEGGLGHAEGHRDQHREHHQHGHPHHSRGAFRSERQLGPEELPPSLPRRSPGLLRERLCDRGHPGHLRPLRTTTTADAPIRISSGGGSSSAIRTGKRWAIRIQFSSRLTGGTPAMARSSRPATAEPTLSTDPRRRTPGSIITYPVTRSPGRMLGSSVSRKSAMMYHCEVSIRVNSAFNGSTHCPTEVVTPTTRPSNGARTTVFRRSRSAWPTSARAARSCAARALESPTASRVCCVAESAPASWLSAVAFAVRAISICCGGANRSGSRRSRPASAAH